MVIVIRISFGAGDYEEALQSLGAGHDVKVLP